jgi:hypothetical protein
MKGPLTLVSEAWDIVVAHRQLFIGIYLVPGLIMLLFELVNDRMRDTPDPLFMGGMFVAMIIMLVSQVLMATALMYAAAHLDTTVKAAYAEAKRIFWPMVWVSILSGVIIFAGIIFFIIPGIIFSVWFIFASYVLLYEGTRGFAALKESKAMVKGKWWAVFGRVVVLILFSFIVGIGVSFVDAMIPGGYDVPIIFFFVSAFLVPVATNYLYLLYREVRAHADKSEIEKPAEIPQVS